MVRQRLVGEESKQPVVHDRPSDRPAPIVKAVFISHITAKAGGLGVHATWQIAVIAVVLGVGVQTGTMRLEEQTSVVLVGSVL